MRIASTSMPPATRSVQDDERRQQRVDDVEHRFLVFLVVLVVRQRLGFMIVSSATRSPKTRPLFPRTSSGTSGFFFCGMIELPVQKRSARRMKPKPGLDQRTNSSANRDRCIIVSAAAAANSIAKSRSETASSEFSHKPSKPNSRATRSRSIGKPVPASAALPKRQAVDACPAIAESLGVPREHRIVGHEMVAEGHRLRDLEMGEAGHDGRSVRFGQIEQRMSEADDARCDVVDRGAHVQSHVGRDLIIARTAGVQALAGVADQCDQPLLDIDVYVLEVA